MKYLVFFISTFPLHGNARGDPAFRRRRRRRVLRLCPFTHRRSPCLSFAVCACVVCRAPSHLTYICCCCASFNPESPCCRIRCDARRISNSFAHQIPANIRHIFRNTAYLGCGKTLKFHGSMPRNYCHGNEAFQTFNLETLVRRHFQLVSLLQVL